MLCKVESVFADKKAAFPFNVALFLNSFCSFSFNLVGLDLILSFLESVSSSDLVSDSASDSLSSSDSSVSSESVSSSDSVSISSSDSVSASSSESVSEFDSV